jgi:predicted nuclease of predicted toxin-antitoxin system
MKIKLDENIPAGLVGTLTALGHDVDSVLEEGLAGHCDPDVWAGAQASGRFLVTQDLDFSDLRQFIPGTHSGLLLIRLKQPGRRRVASRVRMLFEAYDVASWRGCLVVATEVKVRVHRPASQRAR